MGFRMRKSINLGGGFRINLSKSGIGYSWGVPGYRITNTAKGTTRHTYSLPGTGLSYVDESRKRTNTSKNISGPYNEPPVRVDVLQDINSAHIDQFKSTKFAHITSTIEKTLTMNRWSNILLWCTLLAFAQPFFFIFTVIGWDNNECQLGRRSCQKEKSGTVIAAYVRNSVKLEFDNSFQPEL